MTEALARLLQNGKGAAARLSAKHKALRERERGSLRPFSQPGLSDV